MRDIKKQNEIYNTTSFSYLKYMHTHSNTRFARIYAHEMFHMTMVAWEVESEDSIE